jgi:Na+-driven multidrug efflux pump
MGDNIAKSTKSKMKQDISWSTSHIFMGFVLSLLLATIVFAQTETEERFISGLNGVCKMAKNLLPIIVIVLFVIAAVAYGAGQIFGAEMRGRATGWAINMVVGAIIGLIIFLLSEPVLTMFMSPDQIPQEFCK